MDLNWGDVAWNYNLSALSNSIYQTFSFSKTKKTNNKHQDRGNYKKNVVEEEQKRWKETGAMLFVMIINYQIQGPEFLGFFKDYFLYISQGNREQKIFLWEETNFHFVFF